MAEESKKDERRICPECDKPLWDDATEAERLADPPHICSPLRCPAWRHVSKYDKDLRAWVLTEEETERRAPLDA